jgi:hypothetical protein
MNQTEDDYSSMMQMMKPYAIGSKRTQQKQN